MIGGKLAQPGMFPFMAALTWTAGGYKSQCSGFIISPMAIMAAAHCLHFASSNDTILTANYTARLGSTDRKKGAFVELRAYPHHNYQKKTHSNDISILKPLRGELPLGNNIETIALEKHYVKAERCIAIGWGMTTKNTCISDSGSISTQLRYHEQQVTKLLRKKIHMRGHNSATCKGDSGSPLVELRRGQYVALGILSTGDNTGFEVYTRISPQYRFIQRHAPDAKFV